MGVRRDPVSKREHGCGCDRIGRGPPPAAVFAQKKKKEEKSMTKGMAKDYQPGKKDPPSSFLSPLISTLTGSHQSDSTASASVSPSALHLA